MSERDPIPVLLLRSPTSPSSEDPYHRRLTSPYVPTSLPILSDSLCHQSELIDVLRCGRKPPWQGVIFTSKRTAEAWLAAEAQVESPNDKQWRDTPVFALDSPLQLLAASHFLHPTQLDSCPNATALAHHIVSSSDHDRHGGPFLFPCGDKSLDELPRILREAGHEVVQITAYITLPDPEFPARLEKRLQEGRAGWWVFFAPSSAGMVLDYVGEERLRGYRICAIGETTRRYLVERGVQVDASATRPNADGVWEAIMAVDKGV
ncbi:uroporphyrinogen-III synthase, partial [Tremellales sp. Uapishka_1]